MSDYAVVPCGVPISVQITTGDGAYQKAQVAVPAVQYGSYTLLVKNIPPGRDAASLLQVVSDIDGPNPYAPIWVAAIALVALGLTHAALGHLLIALRVIVPPPVPVSNPSSGTSTPKRRGSSAGVPPGSSTAAVLLSQWLSPFWEFLGYPALAAEVAARQDRKQRAAAEAAQASITFERNNPAGLSEALMVAGALEGYHPFNNLTSRDQDEDDGGAGGDGSSGGLPPNSARSAEKTTVTKPGSAGRITALDTLRGCCLSIMIFVNYGGGSYWFFNHSAWNGLTVADLVFPVFVWMQGVSMAISHASLRSRNARRRDMAWKVTLRSLKLYGLGLFVNNIAALSQARLLGVLQYFAAANLAIGLLDVFVPLLPAVAPAALPGDGSSGAARSSALSRLRAALWQDVGRYATQWAAMAVLAATYLGLQFGLPVPGCPTGYIGAGGLADDGAYPQCTGGAHRYIDELVFGTAHIYHNEDASGNPISAATCVSAYQCSVYDPEGALGWISAAWMTWLGLQAGRVVVAQRALMRVNKRAGITAHVSRWVVWGLALGLLGGGLCGFSKEGGLIPINKNLWSPTFVLVMASIGFLALALLFLVVDVLRLFGFSGAPFVYMGCNSILLYVGSEVFDGRFPFAARAGDAYASHAEAMAGNIIGVLSWMAVARVLFLRKVFVNL